MDFRPDAKKLKKKKTNKNNFVPKLGDNNKYNSMLKNIKLF